MIESQSAARQLSFGVANHAIFYNHINIPQAKIAVAHSGCGSSVAHEQDGVETLGSEQDLNRGPGDMNSVRNNFRGYVGVGKYRADHSGIAVGKWAHRVVNVDRVTRSGINCRSRLRVVRVGVTNRDDDPGFERSGD